MSPWLIYLGMMELLALPTPTSVHYGYRPFFWMPIQPMRTHACHKVCVWGAGYNLLVPLHFFRFPSCKFRHFGIFGTLAVSWFFPVAR
ncbi:hypothetical protein GDO86_019116 [Hymenochirus boettgeri]|uniref:Uncharacterized protein n=1 Tax=Hymenochirus boettgeri TaxID=247094 RepID=A0A8T2IHY8_9PIPI|nr:hypothetical protein GDO86_019116 [Hymenochirus boettgeri]